MAQEAREAHAAATAAHHGSAVHWGYEGPGAPYYWGDLKAEFATCKTGRSQSPIDISAVVVTSLPPIRIDYQATPLEIVNNGHAIQVNYQSGSAITVGGKRFNLLQFHFHSPSEHTIGGKAYPMVAHLVHKADDGQLGVIGVMIKEGKANPLIERLWAHLPETAGTSHTLPEEMINVAELLPSDLTYFNYSGSLTTPPCTEGVHWMVLASPVEASAEQIARFRTLYSNDARPVQPVNGRTIRLGN
ncbi:MAG TPA: carbonic anhydrase family protein [Gammaproteobacteria bacterium]|nr:carbonic anhydrase family protein [Gammaproteobacteria bacterium]